MDPRPIMGTEEEIALVARGAGGIRPAPAELARAVVEEAASYLKHLPSPPPQRRFFLATGGCLYEDLGHAELATAECTDPVKLAGHRIALRQMLAEAAEMVGQVYGLEVRAVANNVDYGFGGARTYGHHLNFLVKGVSAERAGEQLAPLLAVMPIISGTGKMSFAAGSHGFELSQRAMHFTSLLSQHTTGNSRGMVTLKDEPLCSNGTRVHVILIDTAMSQWQLALVPAMLCLALGAIEAGQDLAGPVALAQPVQALQCVSTDPQLATSLGLRNGGTATALDIHEHYLSVLERHVTASGGPSWAREMLGLWAEIVANLRRDSFSEAGRLDWVAKLVLFTQVLQQAGLGWQDVARWTFVLASVRRFKATWPELDPVSLTSSPQVRGQLRRSILGVLEQHFARHGLSWSAFPRIWNAVNLLCETCLRYHTLGREPHRAANREAPGPVTREMVDRARVEPPAGTRAALRGKAITDAPPGSYAGWDFVQTAGRRFVMADAFGEHAAWQDVRRPADKEA